MPGVVAGEGVGNESSVSAHPARNTKMNNKIVIKIFFAISVAAAFLIRMIAIES